MKELTLHRSFFPAVERYADKVGFHDGDHHATFATHADRVLRLADAMRRELGMTHDDRFAVLSVNNHEFLELYHAAFLGAGIICPLNLRSSPQELSFILADSGAKLAFVDRFFADHLVRAIADVRSELPLERIVLIGDGDVPHDLGYEELIASCFPVVPDEPDEEDPVLLMYTGGTTGVPKGALLDNRAEVLNMYHIGLALDFSEDRVYLHQTPMFHSASMGGVLGIPVVGATSVFVPMFDPPAVIDLIERYQVDWTMAVPTMLAMILDHPDFDPERLRSLRDIVYGASPMPAALLERTRRALPSSRLWQGYGMTECSSVLTFLTAADHERGGQILRSAGRPVFGVNLTIRDPEGRELPTGSVGEVWARGGNFMRGYWRRPEMTAEAFRAGWYHTGDEGYLDEEGYVYLVDRVTDMIVSGGENIYTIEVEDAIASHPDVAQVAVIGIPHDVWGEQVHAIVVPRTGTSPGTAELQEHARRSLAGYKVPKSIELRQEPLPLSGALKPLKRELRRPYWANHPLAIR